MTNKHNEMAKIRLLNDLRNANKALSDLNALWSKIHNSLMLQNKKAA